MNNEVVRILPLVPRGLVHPTTATIAIQRKPILTGCREDAVQLGQLLLDIVIKNIKILGITTLDKKAESKLNHGFQILFQEVVIPDRYKVFMTKKFGKEVSELNLVLNAGVSGGNGYYYYVAYGAMVIGTKKFKFQIDNNQYDLAPAQIFHRMKNRHQELCGCKPTPSPATSLAIFFHTK